MCRPDDYIHEDPPTTGGPDTVCACGHWWEEHDAIDDPAICEGCAAGGGDDIEHVFVFWPEGNTAEAIADRGGDPDKWPTWVKQALAWEGAQDGTR
jgi:hypothetical protein